MGLKHGEYFRSIEGAFTGWEQYVASHGPNISWFPLWHTGMPFLDSYVPLYYFAVVAVSEVSGFSITDYTNEDTSTSWA